MVYTLKRKMSNMTTNNTEIIDLNDEDADVTWGGKRTRYVYNYTLQSNNLITDTDDSDVTESVHSIQSKTTMEAISEADLSTDKSCASDCECADQTEFDVVSTSSSCLMNIESNTSDSSTLIDFKITKNIINCDKIDTENGYLPDDTDVQVTSSKTHLPPPACFKTCLQCRKENPNPYFQYCFVCFRYRMDFFGTKPRSKTKNVKRLNVSKPTKDSNFFQDFQKSNQSNSLQGDSTQTKNVVNNITPMNENINNICNICYVMPKNGVFNHGKIGHIYCCYSCAKKLWKKSNKCPLCNVKIKFVTKMIIV
ncbi:protein Mdm4-like [Melanaphis sacchari]|uniref:Protein Mdm4 n=1 Tax=Melanaphis sacchari TaxID=742174 RepID=A0A2H8TZI0_9HEMI|nr:protein Mdm4-like [Melanaphis sacchari]XP_025192310.1 protein Mdm4-like [Melanaphis sacchari]